MSKVATITSLNRTAAKDEPLFIETCQMVLNEEPLERVAEFFDSLNIPRSVGSAHTLDPMSSFTIVTDRIGSYAEEKGISDGMQKFLDRHIRKIKWHAKHPSIEGAENVLFLTRCAIMVTEARVNRLELLLKSQDELDPIEWSYARELMNKSYLAFRNFLNELAGDWIEAMQTAVSREELMERLGSFYEFVDAQIRRLEAARERLEDRRMELTVIPEFYPPVKPPLYFHGDLMARGPWKQFWSVIDNKAHQFREVAG
ncbi:MAG: hypothetical protein ACJAZO_000089 [Myxococcota bacterium]|jgi:hypothetical protein